MRSDVFFFGQARAAPAAVDEESLARQLKLAGCEERASLPFHKMLLNHELPLTIGGGIGQSRVSMLLLGKAHVSAAGVCRFHGFFRIIV